MSLDINIQNLATRMASECKSLRTLINGNAADLSALTTTAKSNLVAAINELDAAVSALSSGSSPTTLDELTDVVVGSHAIGRILVGDGTNYTDVDGTTLYQPRDGDLDSIAALTTTSYGRDFLTLGNQAALMALMVVATTAAPGITRLATDAEALARGATDRSLTPSNLVAIFNDLIDTSTGLGSSNVKVPSQGAVKAYVDALLNANNALVFKGTLDASANPNYPAADSGHLYVISVGGKIGGAAGVSVEAGDLAICIVDASAAGTQAAVGANWDIVQTNVVGAVTGPTSSVDGNFPKFSGTSGKVVADSGIAPSTDGTMAANSDALIPTQKAVRAWSYSKTEIGSVTTDYVTIFETGLL